MIGDCEVEDFDSLINLLGQHEVEDTIRGTVSRDGKAIEFTVTLEPRPFTGGGIFQRDGGMLIATIRHQP